MGCYTAGVRCSAANRAVLVACAVQGSVREYIGARVIDDDAHVGAVAGEHHAGAAEVEAEWFGGAVSGQRMQHHHSGTLEPLQRVRGADQHVRVIGQEGADRRRLRHVGNHHRDIGGAHRSLILGGDQLRARQLPRPLCARGHQRRIGRATGNRDRAVRQLGQHDSASVGQVLRWSAGGKRQVGVELRPDQGGGAGSEPPGVAQPDHAHRVAVCGLQRDRSRQVRGGIAAVPRDTSPVTTGSI